MLKAPKDSLLRTNLEASMPRHFLLRGAASLAALLAAFAFAGARAAAQDLLRNGAFAAADSTGVAAGWRFSGAGASAAWRAGAGPNGEPCQEIRLANPAARANLRQTVKARPGQVLLFRLWVKSEGRVVAYVGRRAMAYTRQGRWQQLVDFVRVGRSGALKVDIRVAGLAGKACSALLARASLRPEQTPPLPPRRTYGVTRLLARGRPDAVIVYPARPACYRAWAREIQDALAQRAGVRFPAVTDVDATEPDCPALKPAYRTRHLILLGRLGVNRAMWTAYGRFLCATDGYYPGGDGYVVRTAANVLRNGKNHIILAGSTEAGARRAVVRFLDHVRRAPLKDGSLDLPWLLDVKLGGACLAAFQADDRLWTTDPWNALLPPRQPGYGTVRRWYHNAMAYYWSGWPSYKRRMLECLDEVLRDQARTHHYLIEFLVRAYDMLDDGDALSPAQRRAMDALLVKNFLGFLTGPDLGWMTVFSPPYDAIEVVNRHSIAPWMADLMMADFIHDYLRPAGALRDVVQYRREEKHPFFRCLVRERWAPSLPGAANTGHEEEIRATLFRYALDHGRYEFFASGHARRALGLEFINHLTGQWTRPAGRLDHHLTLGILASYYRDGRYLRLLRTLPMQVHPTGPFMGRYVNGVHRYVPGAELAPQPVDAFAGVRAPALMPHNARRFRVIGRGRFARPTFPAEKALNFVAFRSGFGPDDDYVAVNGLAGVYPPGVFLAFASCGTNWFGPFAPPGFSPATERYFDQNALHVQRTDRWLTDPTPYASAARLNWLADLRRAGGASSPWSPSWACAGAATCSGCVPDCS